ncbi:MAG TPA: phage tail protein [Trueperaceae bacterium]|nr:phage tail protein [Trueperaceae bacterium]
MTHEEIAALLPEVFRRTLVRGGLLDGLLDVMHGLHEPTERVLRELPAYFDPYRTPDAFVPYLATWLDLDRFLGAPSDPFPAGSGRLRELVANAARLSALRGTAAGLALFLEVATGLTGFAVREGVDTSGASKPFSVLVVCPAEAEPLRPLVAGIVASEKPVHVVASVVFGPP